MSSKIKFLSVAASAIALSLSVASALPAFSQSTNPTTPPQRDRMHRPNFLNLTPEQQARMEQIRQNERSQIDAILTADQKAQLQRDRQNRKPPTGENPGAPRSGENPGTPRPKGRRGMPHQPFASLNLTAEQRTRIEAVMRSSREEMDKVLTPEQRQQLQQHMQQHQQRTQQGQQRRQARLQGNQTR